MKKISAKNSSKNLNYLFINFTLKHNSVKSYIWAFSLNIIQNNSLLFYQRTNEVGELSFLSRTSPSSSGRRLAHFSPVAFLCLVSESCISKCLADISNRFTLFLENIGSVLIQLNEKLLISVQ